MRFNNARSDKPILSISNAVSPCPVTMSRMPHSSVGLGQPENAKLSSTTLPAPPWVVFSSRQTS